MLPDTPQPEKPDRRGPILFGLMAGGVLAPHVFALVAGVLASAGTPPILFVRLILWGGSVFVLYLGYLGIRWLILASVVLGASTLGLEAVRTLQAGYPVPAAEFAALALAQVGGAALLFGSRSVHDWLVARRARRAI
jgi:hypothetical protein